MRRRTSSSVNRVRRILSAQGASEEETARALFDALRYAYTIAYLRHHRLVRGEVLEVGSPEYLVNDRVLCFLWHTGWRHSTLRAIFVMSRCRSAIRASMQRFA